MDAQKRHRGRPATGRSVESLEAHKLNQAIWSGSRSRVWLTKHVHRTWKIYKGMSLFNTDKRFCGTSAFAGNGKVAKVSSPKLTCPSIISVLYWFGCGIEVQLLQLPLFFNKDFLVNTGNVYVVF